MLRKLFSHSSADETYRNQGQAANREDQSTAGESTAPFAWADGPRDPHGCAQHEDNDFAAQTFRHAPRLDRSVGHTFSAVGLNSDCKLWRESRQRTDQPRSARARAFGFRRSSPVNVTGCRFRAEGPP